VTSDEKGSRSAHDSGTWGKILSRTRLDRGGLLRGAMRGAATLSEEYENDNNTV